MLRPAINDDDQDCPPYALVMPTFVDPDGSVHFTRFDGSYVKTLMVNAGGRIPSSQSSSGGGVVTQDFPATAAYIGGVPQPGEVWGVQAGTWYLSKGLPGFRIVGGGGGGLVNVSPDTPPTIYARITGYSSSLGTYSGVQVERVLVTGGVPSYVTVLDGLTFATDDDPLRERNGVAGVPSGTVVQITRGHSGQVAEAQIEQQFGFELLSIVGAASGTYTITFYDSFSYDNPQETTALDFDADAATVQAALEALSSIGPGNATVTGSGTPADPFLITITGGPYPPMFTNSNDLVGAEEWLFDASVAGSSNLTGTGTCITKNRHEQTTGEETTINDSGDWIDVGGSSANVAMTKAAITKVRVYVEFINEDGADLLLVPGGTSITLTAEARLVVDGAGQAAFPFSFSWPIQDVIGSYEYVLSSASVPLSATTHSLKLQARTADGTGEYKVGARTRWVLDAEPVITSQLTDPVTGESLCVDDPGGCCEGGGSGSGSGGEVVDACCTLPAEVRACLTFYPGGSTFVDTPIATSSSLGGSFQVYENWVNDGYYACIGFVTCVPSVEGYYYSFNGYWNSPSADSLGIVTGAQDCITVECDPLHLQIVLPGPDGSYVLLDVQPVGTPCDTPPTGISRADLGSASALDPASGTLTLSGVTVAAGSLLVVHAAVTSYDGATLDTLEFDGAPLDLDVQEDQTQPGFGGGGDYNASSAVFSLQVDVDTTGDIVLVLADSGANTFAAILAVEVVGLADRLLDKTAGANGLTTDPTETVSTGATATTTAADEYVQSGFALYSPDDPAATYGWVNGFTEGQSADDGAVGDAAKEGFRVVSATGNYEGSLEVTSAQPIAWCGVTATYK